MKFGQIDFNVVFFFNAVGQKVRWKRCGCDQHGGLVGERVLPLLRPLRLIVASLSLLLPRSSIDRETDPEIESLIQCNVKV